MSTSAANSRLPLIHQLNETRWLVPSATIPNLNRRVNISLPTCSCPGNAIAHRNGHPCRHEAAVYTHIAGSILEIEGAPDEESISDAMTQIERGGGLLLTRYFCDGHDAPHYGYAPNRRHPIRWSIGLTQAARGNLLSAVERRACLFILRAAINNHGARAA